MKRKSKVKVIVSVLVAVAVLAAAGVGIWYGIQNRNKNPVSVFPFDYVGMTEYWGDSKESYGPVSTNRIQTVFLSGTQSVTEVLVQQGDTVKKGDVLMRFDTTLSDLALERERLGVEKLKLQLENAREELRDIKNMKPMVIPNPDPEPDPEENLGVMLTDNYQISQNKAYDGSSREKALILWIRDSVNLEDAVFEAVRVKAEEYQRANAPAETPVEPDAEPAAETEPTTETEPATEPTEPAPEPPVEINVTQFFVVVKVTDGNMSLGGKTVWQGMEVTQNQGTDFIF